MDENCGPTVPLGEPLKLFSALGCDHGKGLQRWALRRARAVHGAQAAPRGRVPTLAVARTTLPLLLPERERAQRSRLPSSWTCPHPSAPVRHPTLHPPRVAGAPPSVVPLKRIAARSNRLQAQPGRPEAIQLWRSLTCICASTMIQTDEGTGARARATKV
jgi:hypothetical protein